MFDPKEQIKAVERERQNLIRRSASSSRLEEEDMHESNHLAVIKQIRQQKKIAHFGGSMHEHLGTVNLESNDDNVSGKFEFPNSETDYNLDYLDELELNRAFQQFEDI